MNGTAIGNLDLIVRMIELIALIGGGGIFIFKMGRAVSKFEAIGERQTNDIAELKNDFKAVAEATLKLALQEERMNNLSVRITQAEKSIDELRHGEGYIFPLGTHLGVPKP